MLRLARVTPATLQVLRELVDVDGVTWGLRIVAATGRPAGSVYPILARLEEGGWVTSRWDESAERGSRRRLYELTEDGRESAVSLLGDGSTRGRTPQSARGLGRSQSGMA